MGLGPGLMRMAASARAFDASSVKESEVALVAAASSERARRDPHAGRDAPMPAVPGCRAGAMLWSTCPAHAMPR